MTDVSAPPQKIAVVLRDDLPSWQALNATAFLSGAVAGHRPDLLGEAYADGDGTAYLSTFGIPIMVYAAVAGPDLVLAGLAVVGPRNAVDKSVKGAVLHP